MPACQDGGSTWREPWLKACRPQRKASPLGFLAPDPGSACASSNGQCSHEGLHKQARGHEIQSTPLGSSDSLHLGGGSPGIHPSRASGRSEQYISRLAQQTDSYGLRVAIAPRCLWGGVKKVQDSSHKPVHLKPQQPIANVPVEISIAPSRREQCPCAAVAQRAHSPPLW